MKFIIIIVIVIIIVIIPVTTIISLPFFTKSTITTKSSFSI
jgi:hypothetical protein